MTTGELQQQMHAQIAAGERRVAAMRAAEREAGDALYMRFAQAHHADLLTQRAALFQQHSEAASDLQETRHQIAAHEQRLPAAGDEDAYDAELARLIARERRLTRQAQQLAESIGRLDAELHQRIARDVAHKARELQSQYNTLLLQVGAEQQALVRQMEEVGRKAQPQLEELRAGVNMLTVLCGDRGIPVGIDTSMTNAGLYLAALD